MEILVTLLFLAFFGYLSYTVAKRNERNTIIAVFVGMLFGLVGWIFYLILGKTKELKAKEMTEEVERIIEKKK